MESASSMLRTRVLARDSNLQADAELNLFGPPFGRGGPEMGPEVFFRALPVAGRRHGLARRMSAAFRAWTVCPALSCFATADEQSWQVVAQAQKRFRGSGGQTGCAGAT